MGALRKDYRVRVDWQRPNRGCRGRRNARKLSRRTLLTRPLVIPQTHLCRHVPADGAVDRQLPGDYSFADSRISVGSALGSALASALGSGVGRAAVCSRMVIGK